MAKIKITTKTCPLCGYIYEQKQTYEMVHKKKENFYFFDPSNLNSTLLNEECTENVVTKGDQDFEYIYNEYNNIEGPQLNSYPKCIGMFCPKCGIFLNDKICSKYEYEEI